MGQTAGGFRFLDPRVRKNRSGHVTLPSGTIFTGRSPNSPEDPQNQKIDNINHDVTRDDSKAIH